MGNTPTHLKRLRLGKLKIVRRRLLQRYEHQPFISLLAGLYSCRWKRYQREKTEPGQWCCKRKEYAFFILLIGAFCLSLVFLYFWGEAKNDYNDFDWYTYGNLGYWFLWSILILVVAVVLFTYIAVLLVLAVCLLSEGQQLYLHWSHKIGSVIVLLFSISALAVLSKLWGVEWAAVLLSFQLAPENTKMSFEKTIEHGGDSLETDVTMSYDGVPFLMHDRTLKRTTDIQDVFPNWTHENAAMLSWEVLEKLNAGKWFTEKRPFAGMVSLSAEDEQKARNQSIYKLSDFLQLADRANKSVLFDLYRPPKDHPYRDSWINRTLEVILNESSIDPKLVLWLPNDMRQHVHSVAPEFKQTLSIKAPVEELLSNNIVKLNLPYSEMSQDDIRMYAAAKITTNLYVISEPWLFSLAWCSGAHSVTTNAVHTLNKIDQPLFLMTPAQYNLMWILTDIVSALLIAVIFVLHWWRERGLVCCSENTMFIESGVYNAFKTELNMSASEESDSKHFPATATAASSENIRVAKDA
ncbi:glycerophosphodiester phosphodiesterase domain-containing protein 4 isoform X2 [Bombina bombina]|uniref:glycerophosphodiester phosphodiesterase domain-containing protein 4 isoform X2 n=1 Tax=Bombina bombina TaxID=8345 RepID=UPI00235AEDEF|nr:glycerophosphodiester phosphodiesterase domain-containing protein 4 isoform X2 [Bombina bombina]